MDDPAASEETVPQIKEETSADILISLERMIKSHLSSLEKLAAEARKHKGLLDDILNNDPTYRDHSDKAKEASRIKSQTRQQVLKQPQAADLSNKIKSARSEIAELQSALSDYLREYERMSGVNEIEDDTGEVREIVYTARLVKKGTYR